MKGLKGKFMSDVFISYAHEDRPLAEALAKDLGQRGYSVWWDAELVGSDNFQDVILAAQSQSRNRHLDQEVRSFQLCKGRSQVCALPQEADCHKGRCS